jgi:hypothetical protein
LIGPAGSDIRFASQLYRIEPENTAMPTNAKPEAKDKEGRQERRRLGYLRIRAVELRKELAAVKKETTELRAKLGLDKKGGKGKGKGAGDDED